MGPIPLQSSRVHGSSPQDPDLPGLRVSTSPDTPGVPDASVPSREKIPGGPQPPPCAPSVLGTAASAVKQVAGRREEREAAPSPSPAARKWRGGTTGLTALLGGGSQQPAPPAAQAPSHLGPSGPTQREPRALASHSTSCAPIPVPLEGQMSWTPVHSSLPKANTQEILKGR